MFLPSLNPVNCWKAVKLLCHNVTGNGGRDGSKSQEMKQSAISSQASWKQVEGSTTSQSSLSPLGYGGMATSAGVLPHLQNMI